MDFVVLGFGIGAFAVLLGLAVRDLGPFARRIPRDGALTWSEVAARAAWGRACRAGGLVLALAGGVLCLLTGVTLLVQVSDSSGMRVVLSGVVLAALAIAAWVALYVWRPPFVVSAADTASAPTRASQRTATSTNRTGGSRAGRDRDRRSESEPSEPNVRRQRSNNRRSTDSGESRSGARRSARGNDADPIEGPRLGALTVDAMGGLRRASISSPDHDDLESISDPSTAAERAAPRRDSDPRPERTQRPGRDRRSG